MNKKVKQILLYWRIPLYFLVATCLLTAICLSSPKLEGPVGAIALFVTFPGFVISFVWALFMSIKKPIEFNRNGWPEDVRLPEAVACENFADSVRSEYDSVAELSPGMKARYFIFKLVGILCIIGGIVLALIGIYIIGTLVIIAGATLCIVANPRSYNAQVDGVRMVPCEADDDINKIYDFCRYSSTPLGTPYLAEVRGFKTDVMVYGPDSDDNSVIVYHAPKADYFYVSGVFMPERIERILSEPGTLPEEQHETFDEDFTLELIAANVEAAVEH